jgi:hypothetical protein
LKNWNKKQFHQFRAGHTPIPHQSTAAIDDNRRRVIDIRRSLKSRAAWVARKNQFKSKNRTVSNQPWPGWSARTCATHGAMRGYMCMHDHWSASPVRACAASTRAQLRHTHRCKTAACRAAAVEKRFFPFDCSASNWLALGHPHSAKNPRAIAEPFTSNGHFDLRA